MSEGSDLLPFNPDRAFPTTSQTVPHSIPSPVTLPSKPEFETTRADLFAAAV